MANHASGKAGRPASRRGGWTAVLSLPAVLLSALCLSPTTAAQGSTEQLAQDAREQFIDYGKACERGGDLVRARLAWLEALVMYAPGDETLRDNLLRTRDALRTAAERGVGDSPPRGAERLWHRLATRLADGHRAAAAAATDSGARAEHWRRVRRFAPEDAEAGRALDFVEIDDRWYAPEAARGAVRARARQQVIELLKELEWPTDEPESGAVTNVLAHHPDLCSALRGLRGPTFELWSTHSPKVRQQAVQSAERAGLLIRSLLATSRDEAQLRRRSDTILVGVQEYGQFDLLIEASDADDATKDLVREHQLIGLRLQQGPQRLYAARMDPAEFIDLATRQNCERQARVSRFALKAGTNHAICQWLHGRSLFYYLDIARAEGDATSSQELSPQISVPDRNIWFVLAREQAWLGTGPNLFDLLGLDSSNMNDAARIRSWAVAQYLLAEDPRLLRQMDDAHPGTGGRPADFWFEIEAVSGRTQRDILAGLSDHWRYVEHPDGAAPAPRVRGAKQRALAALVDLATARARALRAPFGAVLGLPPELSALLDDDATRAWCRGEAEFEDLDDATRTALEESGAGLTELPVETLRGAAERDHLAQPYLRHLLLAAELDTARFVESNRQLLLLQRPLPPSLSTIAAQPYPADGAAGVPAYAELSELGKILANRLDRPAETARIGFPISLHLGSVSEQQLADADCKVTVDGAPIDGLLSFPDPHNNVRLAPPHTLVFYPAAPLPARTAIQVEWSWPGLTETRSSVTHSFRTR